MDNVQIDSVTHGDCLEVMKEIPDGSVDMTITSPPYDNLRTYNGSLDWGDHVWKPVIQHLYRVTKQGGVVVWIVGDATINGSETGTSFKQALYFKECGFNLHDTMIWNKQEFTATGSLATRYAPVFEYMFILSKGSISTFNPIKDRVNKHAGSALHGTIRQADASTVPLRGKTNKTIAKHGQRHNVWNMNGDKASKLVGHPAMFPLRLATDHILSWSNECDVVLDCFAGSGTTGVACLNTNRRYILIEKEQKYYDICVRRCAEAKQNLIVTQNA